MARKKKNNSDGGGIFAIVIFVITGIIIIAPIFVLILYFYSKSKIKSMSKTMLNENGNLWLNNKQKRKFIDIHNNCIDYSSHIEKAHNDARLHNIAINQDGSYNRRSNKGKEVMDILNQCVPLLKKQKESLKYLATSSQEIWSDFIMYNVFVKSCFLSLISWFISYIFLCIKNNKNILTAFIDYISFKSDDQHIFFISGLACIVVFGLSYFINKNSVIKKIGIPKPEKVTAANFDKF